MKTLFKWLFIAIGIILGTSELYSTDVNRWHTNGTVFSMEFEATPICVRGDTVVGIPRGESQEISINNRNGKLSLTYSRISGMQERIVDDFFVEQYGGQVVEKKTYLFSGMANRNGKSEPCSFKITVNNANPNTEVFDFSESNDANVYYDRYEIKIGNLKWVSNDPTNLFSDVVPEAKKVQKTLLRLLLGKSNNGTNRKATYSKPPLKK